MVSESRRSRIFTFTWIGFGDTSLLINIVSYDHVFAVDNIHVTYDPAPPTPAAVPEPATLTLIGLGALAMANRIRRRTRGTSST